MSAPAEGKSRQPKSVKILKPMERLARSSYGKWGIGACPNAEVREGLIAVGLAKRVKGAPDHILALTLKGFRALEEMRWRNELKKASNR